MKVLFIIYDNGSHVGFFPSGPAYLTSALEAAGHEVSIYNQDVTHAPESELLAHLNENVYDVVGLGFQAGYYQYRKACKIAAAVNSSSKRNEYKFILGGHGPAAAPEFFLKKLQADTVFNGEAISSIIDYVNILPICPKEVGHPGLVAPDDMPFPAYHRFPIDHYKLIRWPTSKTTDFCMPILSGMGCKFKCTFCFRLDKGFRPRSPESVIEEIMLLWNNYRINHFQFSDELFMSSENRAKTFCNALLESKDIQGIRDFKWDCNGRLNYAKPDVLKIMKEAGCEYINYGIESLDQKVLNNINKGLTIDQIYTGIENTLKLGLVPGINFMWGNIGDTSESLDKAANFIIKYNSGHELRTLRPVTPYPGSPLFEEAIKRGLVKDVEDFYDNKHVNSDLLSCNFTQYSDEEFHSLLYKANLRIMKSHYDKKLGEQNREAFNCYMGFNNGFRGFRGI